MKLHWSPKSPFVRKVVITAFETGALDSIELVRSPVVYAGVNPSVMKDNPLNKIPTLVLDDGSALYDSLIICEYLDSSSATPGVLVPVSGAERWTVLRRSALADGLLTLLLLWRSEQSRPAGKISETHLVAFAAKVHAALGRFESEIVQMREEPFRLDQITLGCALQYLDFRFKDLAWRSAYPGLAAWEAVFAQRPSALATAVTDDESAPATDLALGGR